MTHETPAQVTSIEQGRGLGRRIRAGIAGLAVGIASFGSASQETASAEASPVGSTIAPNGELTIDVGDTDGLLITSTAMIPVETGGFINIHNYSSPGHLQADVSTDKKNQVRSGLSLTQPEGGQIQVFSNVTADVVVDQLGSVTPGSYDPTVEPYRWFDERLNNFGEMANDRLYVVRGKPGEQFFMNLTATGATKDGYVSYSGEYDLNALTNTAVLNVEKGQTISQQFFGEIGQQGMGYFYVQAGTYLVGDLQAILGKMHDGVGSQGESQKVFTGSPRRLVDTRGGAKVPAGGELIIPVGLPSTVVAARIAAINCLGPGWADLRTAGTPYNGTASLTISEAGKVDGGLTIAETNAQGNLVLKSYSACDYAVDLQGSFISGAIKTGPKRLVDTRPEVNPTPPVEPIPEPGVLTQLSATGRNPITVDEISGVSCLTSNRNVFGEKMTNMYTRRVYANFSGLPPASKYNGNLTEVTVQFVDDLGRLQFGYGFPDESGKTLVTTLTDVYGNMSPAEIFQAASRAVGMYTIKVYEPDLTIPVADRWSSSTFKLNLTQCNLDLI